MNKKILIGIIILTILIFLVLSILILYKSQESNKIENLGQISDDEEEIISISEIAEEKEVYHLERLINYYIDDIMIAEEESQEEESATEIEEVKILEQLGIDTGKQFLAQNAYLLEVNEKNTLYFIKGNIVSKNLNEIGTRKKEERIFTITVDKENMTFDILPYKKEFSDFINYQDEVSNSEIIDEEGLKWINKNIEENYFNTYAEAEVTDEEMAKRYYEDYQRNALYFSKDAYEMIDEEYKKIRFPTYQDYQEYINELKEQIEESALAQYGVNEIDGYIQYSLVDTAKNSYFIKASKTSPMDYKILLDNYTIKTEGFEEKYNKLSDEQKVETNAHIFLQMLNTKDYEHAYELLSNNFKNNNFKTLEEFKNYVQNNLLRINIEVNSEITQEGKNFVYHLKLQDSDSSDANKKNMTIIMQLLEGMDFVMSFSIE